MPIHNWQLVDASIFYSFHLSWTVEICRALNRGLLPPNYYALTEMMGHPGQSLFQNLQYPPSEPIIVEEPSGGVDKGTVPPQTRFHARAEGDIYAANAKNVVVRHQSDHRVIAAVLIVSPGNKSNRHGLRSFVEKATTALRDGIHKLIVELFPPGPCDPQGLFKAVWDDLVDNDFTLPEEKPLTLTAYIADKVTEAFIEPVAVGDILPDMPLFLAPDIYVPVPLEATYRLAWQAFPSFWREVLEKPPPAEEK